jgi:signal transduction histidine kinase/DNA-binding response OmpR family regulator
MYMPDEDDTTEGAENMHVWSTGVDASSDEINILLVDDRPDKMLSLEAVIADLGVNIVRATSGREALRCLLRQEFAVILLDVNMPGMDGFETAALIRQRPRCEHTPIIFISAVNDTQTHVSRGYSLGAVDYILTPIVPDILKAKVGVFVELFRKTQQIRRQAQAQANLIRAEVARAEAESARERWAFLAEASNTLGGSLKLEETFQNLARVVVPRMADGCIVDRVEPDGQLSLMAVAHSDSRFENTLRELRQSYPLQIGSTPVLRAVAEGKTTVCRSVEAGDIERLASREGEAEAWRKLNLTAYMLVPITTRDGVFGTICLVSTSLRSFDEMDCSMAEEIAQRASLALENAILYHSAQQAQEAAERASEAKDQFLAMLSHELRTPLSPVLAATSDIDADESVPEPFRELSRMIRRNVEIEARLIDDLLDLTRISKGKLELKSELLDLHDLLTDTLEICNGETADKNITMAADLGARHHCLEADSARLQQVFWNLLKNAIKFSKPGGKVTIATTNPEDRLIRVEIRDTGAGIEKEALPRIFGAFEQGAGHRAGGLGLGLAISRALVELHHGTISALSEGPKSGATFVVELPTARTGGSPIKSRGSRTFANGKRTPLRLLMVEDHPDTNRSLERILTRRGYTVRTAFTVQEAIQHAGDFEFDVLVSDIGLPDGTGFDVIKTLARCQHFKSVALSGYGMEKDIARSKEAGFTAHLTKPVDIDQLDALIQGVWAEGASG